MRLDHLLSREPEKGDQRETPTHLILSTPRGRPRAAPAGARVPPSPRGIRPSGEAPGHLESRIATRDSAHGALRGDRSRRENIKPAGENPPPPAPGGAGCHGRTADALARGADEGRGEQRYSRARRTRPLTPGCPNGGTRQARAWHPVGEHIAFREATGGTETSKYPEEGKSTETPRVAASERGPAQTGRAQSVGALRGRGCGRGSPGVRHPGGGQKAAGGPNRMGGRAEQGYSPVGPDPRPAAPRPGVPPGT